MLRNSTVAQRDAELYAPDPEVWRPERWLVSREVMQRYESASFVFGMGFRMYREGYGIDGIVETDS